MIESMISELLYTVAFAASYILPCWAMFTISKRRGLPHPWLAWVPVVCVFQLGTIADHARLAGTGKMGLCRWGLLISGILRWVGITAFLGGVVLILVQLLPVIITVGLVFLSDQYNESLAEAAAQAGALCSAGFLLCIPYFAIHAIARFRVYRSCNPATALWFLLLSLVLPWLHPVFLFLDARKAGETCAEAGVTEQMEAITESGEPL